MKTSDVFWLMFGGSALTVSFIGWWQDYAGRMHMGGTCAVLIFSVYCLYKWRLAANSGNRRAR